MTRKDRQMDAKVGGSPGREPGYRYRGATPGTSIDEVTNLQSFHMDESSDDENTLDADLVEAGVDGPRDIGSQRSPASSDREYALSAREGMTDEDSEGNEESLELLGDAEDDISDDAADLGDIETDEDEGFDSLPNSRPLRANRAP